MIDEALSPFRHKLGIPVDRDHLPAVSRFVQREIKQFAASSVGNELRGILRRLFSDDGLYPNRYNL